MSVGESVKSAVGAFLNAFGISKPKDTEKKPDWRTKAAEEAAAQTAGSKKSDQESIG